MFLAGQRRIRPIIMTSLTTILALFPLTLGFGESASLRSPMAWAVIGGLITSTMLTLVVIPCIYMVFGQLGKIQIKRRSMLVNKHFLIQRKVLISMLFIAATLLGYISWKQLKMEIFPQCGVAHALHPGKLQDRSHPGVHGAGGHYPGGEYDCRTGEYRRDRSPMQDRRMGSILISYEERTDLKYAYLKLDEQVASIRGDLPDEFQLSGG